MVHHRGACGGPGLVRYETQGQQGGFRSGPEVRTEVRVQTWPGSMCATGAFCFDGARFFVVPGGCGSPYSPRSELARPSPAIYFARPPTGLRAYICPTTLDDVIRVPEPRSPPARNQVITFFAFRGLDLGVASMVNKFNISCRFPFVHKEHLLLGYFGLLLVCLTGNF